MFGLFAMHVSDAWSYCVAIHPCVAIPHCLGTSSCVTSSVKREAVIVGLASEGLALILGSAETGSSAVVGPMPTDPVEFRKCARDLKALSATKEHTNEERGLGRDPGVSRPGAGRGQLPARWEIFRAAMHEFPGNAENKVCEGERSHTRHRARSNCTTECQNGCNICYFFPTRGIWLVVKYHSKVRWERVETETPRTKSVRVRGLTLDIGRDRTVVLQNG